MRTIGSRRRAALTRSRARVSSFSLASSCLRAASHSSRDTTSGRLLIVVISALPAGLDSAPRSTYVPLPTRLSGLHAAATGTLGALGYRGAQLPLDLLRADPVAQVQHAVRGFVDV